MSTRKTGTSAGGSTGKKTGGATGTGKKASGATGKKAGGATGTGKKAGGATGKKAAGSTGGKAARKKPGTSALPGKQAGGPLAGGGARLGARMRRSGQSANPAGLQFSADSVAACLKEPADKTNNAASLLADMAAEFPNNDFSAEGEAGDVMPPARDAILAVLVRNVDNGLDLNTRGVAVDLGVKVQPQDLGELAEQDISCRGIYMLATRIADSGMDRRGVEGAFGWFLVDRLLTYLGEEAARLQRQQREALLGSFLNMLVLVDKEMRHEQDRKVELGADRAQREAEAQAAEAEAQAVLTRQEWRANQPVSRAALLQAARHLLTAQTDQGQGPEDRVAPR